MTNTRRNRSSRAAVEVVSDLFVSRFPDLTELWHKILRGQFAPVWVPEEGQDIADVGLSNVEILG